MAAPLSVEQQIKQLEEARKLVLSDPSHYPSIIRGILPIIGPSASVEFRRWGADFLAETFASPTLPSSEKEPLSLTVLETLKSMIENPHEDSSVVKSIVQAAASIYPLVFRWIINNPYDTPTWDRIQVIKSRILRIWDTASPGVRVCCIKFAQRVVLVQTVGPESDSRRSNSLEISLSMVPQNHPLMQSRNLEAEASGLLDRMLYVLQENSSNAVIVDATLNSLSILIRARPHISNKILNVILNFNPLKHANSPMTPKLRVMVKSMEKTTRSLLIHISKRDPQNPLAGRIQQHIERLMRSRTEIFDDASRKRGPPEPVDGLDAAKRQRLGAQIPAAPVSVHIPPLSPGPHTIAELFTATGDEALKSFDVSQLSQDLVVKISVTILSKIDPGTINQTVEGIRTRLSSFNTAQPELLNPNTAPLSVEEDDDDYEPDFQLAEDTEQILNKLDNAPPDEKLAEPDMPLGPFTLPQPPPLTLDQALQAGQMTVAQIFSHIQSLEEPSSKRPKGGINRLAATTQDREAWLTIVTRLATRSVAGLEESMTIKEDPHSPTQVSIADRIREYLYLYVIEDFRKRIDTIVSWLCEEWYNDQVLKKVDSSAVQHYDKWALKVLDGIVPYLDAKDKVLTRFLSEIPTVSSEMLERVKGLCRDPAMVNLALTSLLYLVMMKPPVRELALDAVQDIWNTYDDAKPIAAKYLSKWRPGFAEAVKGTEPGEETKPNGVAISAA